MPLICQNTLVFCSIMTFLIQDILFNSIFIIFHPVRDEDAYASLRHTTVSTTRHFANAITHFATRATGAGHSFVAPETFCQEMRLFANKRHVIKKPSFSQQKLRNLFWRSDVFWEVTLFDEVTHFFRLDRSLFKVQLDLFFI